MMQESRGYMQIKTDMPYFQSTPKGFQIHSGNADNRYDYKELTQGKYLPCLTCHDVHLEDADYVNIVFTWNVE
jgi:hypothetical protein